MTGSNSIEGNSVESKYIEHNSVEASLSATPPNN